MLCGRDDLELDVADDQVVQRLLADQAHQVSFGRDGLRISDLPAGEVAAAGVEDLARLQRPQLPARSPPTGGE
jgi:hypothetical protein